MMVSRLTVYKVGVIFLLLVIVIWYLKYQSWTNDGVENNVYHQQRILRFTYELANTTNRAIKDAEFSTYLPVSLMANQSLKNVTSSVLYKLESSATGNSVAHFRLGLIPPFGKKKVTIATKVDMADLPNRIEVGNQSSYLKPEKYIESNSNEIISLAKKLQRATDLESVKSIYKWVSSSLKDSGYTSQDKGALYALESLEGDCTEHMYLVIALARSLGIPARAIGGYVYETNAVVSAADYHNWAEVYLDGIWQIVDTQKKSFMKNHANYVAMRTISSPEVSLLGSSHRFLVATDGVQVSMK